jgi:hypothetical protein
MVLVVHNNMPCRLVILLTLDCYSPPAAGVPSSKPLVYMWHVHASLEITAAPLPRHF